MSMTDSTHEVNTVDVVVEENPQEFFAWYRHSGENEIPELSPFQTMCNSSSNMKPVKDYRVILQDIGSNYITHMYVGVTGIAPNLGVICPRVTHLRICMFTGSDNKIDFIEHCKEVCKLEIHNTDLSANGFPDVFSKLTSVKELYLDWCILPQLPEKLQSLASLKHLQVLSLPGGRRSIGYPEVVSSLTNLTHLYLPMLNITELPWSFSSLKNLRELSLSRNKFANHQLPVVVCELTELVHLDLTSCDLIDLPQSFCRLTKLEHLILTFNNLKILPPPIYSLTNLICLFVFGNLKLRTFDKAILNLEKLEELHFGDCHALKEPPWKLCFEGIAGVRRYFMEREASRLVD